MNEQFTDEKWKSVVGYEEFYSVSNTGKIRRDKGGSNNAKIGRILKQRLNTHGYVSVILSKFGTEKSFTVHRLVVKAFIGEIPDGLQINHKNGNKTDNRLENLECVTPSENRLHCNKVLFPNGENFLRGDKWCKSHLASIPRGEKQKMAKLNEQKVKEIRQIYGEGQSTLKQLAEKYGVHFSIIHDVIKRTAWKHVE